MTKLESIASSAVRAADKVGASLIIVYTQSGIQHKSTKILQSFEPPTLPFGVSSWRAIQMGPVCCGLGPCINALAWWLRSIPVARLGCRELSAYHTQGQQRMTGDKGVMLCRADSKPGQQVQATNAYPDAGHPHVEERRHEVDTGGPRSSAAVPDPARPAACPGRALPLRSDPTHQLGLARLLPHKAVPIVAQDFIFTSRDPELG